MSDFASMLASFKSNAVASISSSNSSALPQSSSTTPNQTTRKRSHPDSAAADGSQIVVGRTHTGPSFPSMHESVRNKHHKYQGNGGEDIGFELSFLVIGAQKAGTSWLHSLLQKCSPNTRISLPREQKEVHFWDWHYRKGFQWYIRQFDFPRKKLSLTHKNMGEGTSSAATATNNSNINDTLYGEITPCYVVLPPSTISEINKCFPNLKLIFIARDMVDRVWSAMIMELRDQCSGRTAGEFAKGVIPGNYTGQLAKAGKSSNSSISVAQERRMQQQSSPSSQPDTYFLERLRSETHSSRSNYARHLRHWYAHFPAKNILILDYKEIDTDPRGVLRAVLVHIGIEEDEAKACVEALQDEEVRQRVNAATSGLNVGTTSQYLLSQRPSLKKQIQDYVRPFAVEFNVMLKEQGYNWSLNE